MIFICLLLQKSPLNIPQKNLGRELCCHFSNYLSRWHKTKQWCSWKYQQASEILRSTSCFISYYSDQRRNSVYITSVLCRDKNAPLFSLVFDVCHYLRPASGLQFSYSISFQSIDDSGKRLISLPLHDFQIQNTEENILKSKKWYQLLSPPQHHTKSKGRS